MNRKQFLTLLSVGAATAVPWLPALGQGSETRYRSLKAPAPTDTEAGKIEVVEFFWFGCPHCFSLEPLIDKWSSNLPPDVDWRQYVDVGPLHAAQESIGLEPNPESSVVTGMTVARPAPTQVRNARTNAIPKTIGTQAGTLRRATVARTT